MKIRPLSTALIAALILGIFSLTATASLAAPADHIYAELLTEYVKDGAVDYHGLKKEEGKLDSYLASLNATDPATLPPREAMALYINTYNAYTLKLILDNFKKDQPPSSIKKAGGLLSGPWRIKFVRLGGASYSLNDIEHEILRPTYKDPRIHFAVNCASKSCPILISEPYTAEDLERQLDANAVYYLHDTAQNRLEGNTLYLSSIFKWYKEDFNNDPAAYVAQYARGDLKSRLDAAREKGLKIKYLDYDWSLNSN